MRILSISIKRVNSIILSQQPHTPHCLRYIRVRTNLQKNITFTSMLTENAVLNKAKHPRKICFFCYFSSFPLRNIIINEEVTFPIACRNLCAFITVHNCVHLEPFPFAVEPTWYDRSRPSSSVPSCGTNTRQVLFSRNL